MTGETDGAYGLFSVQDSMICGEEHMRHLGLALTVLRRMAFMEGLGPVNVRLRARSPGIG